MALLALPLLTLLATLAAPADEWILVRGSGDGVGSLDWDRIGEAYLGRQTWRAVDASAADSEAATSRLMAGAPADHPALAALLPVLGIQIDADAEGVAPAADPDTAPVLALIHAERRIPAGTGLVIVTADPDGQGALVLFTGVDEASAFQGFTTSIDLSRPGVTYVREGRQVPPSTLMRFPAGRLEVVPLDILWWTAGAWDEQRSINDRALAVSRALEGYRFVYEAATIPGIDLLAFAADLLASFPADVDAGIALGGHHDLIVEARVREALLGELLGPRRGPAPVVYSLIGHPGGTNAKTFGADPITGRPALLLNLCAFADPAALDLALVHELVHTRQSGPAQRLVERAVHEGVAALISARIEGAGDAAALMWSEESLALARARHVEIVAAVKALADSTDAALHAPWMTLGLRPQEPAGLPDRAAYYAGFLAARAWLGADAARTPAALLAASPDEVLAALR